MKRAYVKPEVRGRVAVVGPKKDDCIHDSIGRFAYGRNSFLCGIHAVFESM
jgi:hypothetical protein